jgi:hypothetical protein
MNCWDRSRGGGSSSPAEGPSAPCGPAATSPPRPAVHGRVEQSAAPGPVSGVRGQLPDAPSLVPGARAEEVDLPSEVDGRKTADLRRGSRPHPADGKGEPQVGMYPDPRRARQARHQGLGDQDEDAPARERSGPGSPPRGSNVEHVPARRPARSSRWTSSPWRRSCFGRCTYSSRSTSRRVA